jgi:hypothetical protein
MITIRKLNFLTDCYRDLAGDIQAILDELYEESPWTFEQTFGDLFVRILFIIWLLQKNRKLLVFWRYQLSWMKLKSPILALPKLINRKVLQAYCSNN